MACIDRVYTGAPVTTASLLAFSLLEFAPLGAAPVVTVALLLEARVLGWRDCSLRRLLECRTRSCRTDLGYFILYASGALPVVSFALSLGGGYLLCRLIEAKLGMRLLRDANPALAFGVQFLVGSLVFYIVHWVQHTRFLWEFHKVHHAAEEMDMVNNFRDHPFTHALRLVFEAVPGALLGVSPGVMLAYVFFTGFLVVCQHSNWEWKMPWVERYLFVGASSHFVHHSVERRHYMTNLGYLVLWERLFGTWYPGTDVRRIGLGEEGSLHNRDPLFSEMGKVLVAGLRALLREVTRPAGA